MNDGLGVLRRKAERWIVAVVVFAGLVVPASMRAETHGPPRPHDAEAAERAGRDAGPAPDALARNAHVTAADATAADTTGATFRVFATQYHPNTSGSVEVAIPDRCAKFASLGWTSALASAGCPTGYELDLDWRVRVVRDSGQRLTIPVKDVGPWNTDDNYWNGSGGPRPRRLFRDLPRGTPEAQAAFYDGYNTVPDCKTLGGSSSGHAGPADQFGRCVLNPAGIDLSVAAAAALGLAALENEWVNVTFLWERKPAGRSYLLWHNPLNGRADRWTLKGADLKRSMSIRLQQGARFPGADWIPVATGDVNRDDRPDLLWRNRAKDKLVVWLMKGTMRIGRQRIDPQGEAMSPAWTPFAMDDFDRDGRPDIAWHNADTGRVVLWYLRGTSRARSVTIDLPAGMSWPAPEWIPFGTADFDRDKKPDIAWRNADTGRVVIWYLRGGDGATFSSSSTVTRVSGASWPSPSTWDPIGGSDVTNDGIPDIVWHDTSDGSLRVWTMRGDDGSEEADSVQVTAESFPTPPRRPIVWR